MNHLRLRDMLRELGDKLAHEFDVPTDAVEDIIAYAEQTAIISETRAKNDRQYEMAFREHGSRVMAQRYGITQQAARKRFNKIIRKPKQGLVVSA